MSSCSRSCFAIAFARAASWRATPVGNLFVAALQEMTGDFAQAIRLANQVLATRGQIYPATTSNVTLAARMDSGEIVRGETRITGSRDRIAQLTLEVPHADSVSGDGTNGDAWGELRPARVPPLPETLAAIAEADVITLGPGSLFTSVITNLLVDGIPEALAQAKGLRVYVCNLMTQANESLHLTAVAAYRADSGACSGGEPALREQAVSRLCLGEHGAGFAEPARALRGRGRGNHCRGCGAD